MHSIKARWSLVCSGVLWTFLSPFDLTAQAPLVPNTNAVGLADQRLNLLSAEGYQLIEQANQALQARLFARAGDRISQLLFQYQDALVPLPAASNEAYRNFVSVPEFVKAWVMRMQMPDAIARGSGDATLDLPSSLAATLQFGNQHPVESMFSEWHLAVSDELLERGDFLGARIQLDRQSVVPVMGVKDIFTGRWQRSPELDETTLNKLLVRRVVLDILEGRESQARKLLESLSSDARTELGGRTGSLHELVRGFYHQHLDGDSAGVEFQPRSPGAELSPLSISGKPAWQIDLEQTFQGRGREQKLEVVPTLDGDRLFVNSLNGILAFNAHDGTSLFGDSAESAWIYHNSEVAVADWYDPAIPYWGTARPRVHVEGDLLAARQGDPVLTHHLSVAGGSVRSNSIVVLDLSEQGRMLDGFPLTLPTPTADSYRVFATRPLICGENLLVGIRENQAFQCRHFLACYDLANGHRKWECYLGSARPIANRKIADLMSADVTLLGTQAIISTNTGLVASVDLSGQLNWVCSYPRTYHNLASAELETRIVRNSTVGFNRDQMSVLFAPADSEQVFSLDIHSGVLLEPVLASKHSTAELTVFDDGSVVLYGRSISQFESNQWVDVESESLQEDEAQRVCSMKATGRRILSVSSAGDILEFALDDSERLTVLKTTETPFVETRWFGLNERFLILFDGKMITAVDASP